MAKRRDNNIEAIDQVELNSKEDFTIEIVLDHNGLKVGDIFVESGSVAQVLVNRGIAKLK